MNPAAAPRPAPSGPRPPCPWVFLNGQFVPPAQAVVSVFDRGFLYGDGLFETIRVHRGRAFRWPQHWRRLQRGAEFLRLRVPFDEATLTRRAAELIQRNAVQDGLLRLNLSRGVGPSGYATRQADAPCLVMSLHPLPAEDADNPPRWRVITSSVRVPTHDRLALYKTTSKLGHVLARREAEERGADEALLLNTDGEVAEASAGNVFWVAADGVFTPPLATGILAGVTRDLVLELCRANAIPCEEKAIAPAALRRADAVFLTLSSRGVVEVSSLDERCFEPSPLVRRLQESYREVLERECAA